VRLVNRCLVVDDSRVMRKIARAILEELKFDTAEAEDSTAALQYCRVQMPELILLDWNLPNASGVEFVRSLRRAPDGRHPVVVFCTTENDAADIAGALAAGANEYVMKPFDREALKAKLAQVGLI
jgi:two-component system chemotaxis response regulator CheY